MRVIRTKFLCLVLLALAISPVGVAAAAESEPIDFVSNQGGDAQIYRINADGSEPLA
jgi:hypothetical protein